MELYYERLEEKGKRKADLRFIIDVILLFRPGIIRPAEGHKNLNNYGMYKSHFKTSWRNLIRNKGYAAINIVGLTLGITCSIVLFLIVKKGNSYDKYHAKGDRIYRAVTKSKGNEGFKYTQGIPVELPDALKEDISGIEEVAFTSYRRGSLISVYSNGQVKKYEEPKGLAFTEPSFFKLFDRKILIGSAAKCLDDPHEAIISQKWALKYFGKSDPVGELVEYDNVQYKITSVMEDFPDNTDLPFDLLLSYATVKIPPGKNGWSGISDGDNCYFLLKGGQSIASVEAQMPAFVKKHMGDDSDEAEIAFIMQPLHAIHSDSRFGNNGTKLPIESQIAFSIIGVFLLITACINFINLTTAEAIKRVREVGVRKVLGSSRRQLVSQFLIEAFTITILATLVSLGAVQLALGFLNPMMEFSLSLNLFSDSKVLLFLLALVIVIAFLSGLYPAWMVSGFQPVLALKNQMSSGKNSSGYVLRKGLVVFQFFISQFFLITTIILTRQMDFLQNHETGFSKEAIITVSIPKQRITPEARAANIHALKNEVLRLPGVEDASLNYSPPSNNSVLGSDFSMVGSDKNYNMQFKQADGDYIKLYDIKLIAGEPLPDLDSLTCIVVNEKFVKTAGFATNEEIVGKEVSMWDRKLTVKGVVKDFNTQSLGKAIEPVVLFNDVNGYQNLSIKLNMARMTEAVEKIEKTWKEKYPEFIFSYSFVDEQVKNLYRGERKMASLLNAFTIIAILIGCLGLLGLVAFIANRKTKEVGIRKVLGASVESIIFLFSKEFGKLILIAFALSAPLAGFVMHKMLQKFAYKIEIGPSIFLTGLIFSSLIVFITVGYRSFKASTANPVKSLKTE
ncbi:ABC transporter permease [Cytophagales bacterium WSM2-2]|nr:ABC transporter permease [Cytophagales bacterium WSM2-2]